MSTTSAKSTYTHMVMSSALSLPISRHRSERAAKAALNRHRDDGRDWEGLRIREYSEAVWNNDCGR